jgi:cell division septum initiation protein DivIVA
MDDADAVVPLRPGFDIQVRGFSRNQVVEHIELLEDQLRMVTIDRNEAVRLNNDLRTLCDDTRRSLDRAEQRLKSIESSDTGLPAASQRVQNMLAIAEDEVQTLREQSKRQAEIIRGTAETEARALISEAERAADELREECTELVNDVESRRAKLQREHEQKISEQRSREYRLRQEIRNEYKRVIANAQEESDALIAETRRQCGQWDAESEQMRLEALEEIRVERLRLEELRTSVLAAMDNAKQVIDESAATVRAKIDTTTTPEPSGPVEPEEHRLQQVTLPEQRDDVQTYTIPIEPQHTTNGASKTPSARQN